MKFKKNVTNKELLDNFLVSIEHNEKSLDYIENCLLRAKDNLQYNPQDEDYIEIVENLEYIHFVLFYVGNKYGDCLDKIGGVKHGFNK